LIGSKKIGKRNLPLLQVLLKDSLIQEDAANPDHLTIPEVRSGKEILLPNKVIRIIKI